MALRGLASFLVVGGFLLCVAAIFRAVDLTVQYRAAVWASLALGLAGVTDLTIRYIQGGRRE